MHPRPTCSEPHSAPRLPAPHHPLLLRRLGPWRPSEILSSAAFVVPGALLLLHRRPVDLVHLGRQEGTKALLFLHVAEGPRGEPGIARRASHGATWHRRFGRIEGQSCPSARRQRLPTSHRHVPRPLTPTQDGTQGHPRSRSSLARRFRGRGRSSG